MLIEDYIFLCIFMPESLLITLAELLLGINGLFLLEERDMNVQGPINKVSKMYFDHWNINTLAIRKGHTDRAIGPAY